MGDIIPWDNLDRRIWSVLPAHLKVNFTGLARAVGSNAKKVRRRVERMKHSRVIDGFMIRQSAAMVNKNSRFVLILIKSKTGQSEPVAVYIRGQLNPVRVAIISGETDVIAEFITDWGDKEFYDYVVKPLENFGQVQTRTIFKEF